MKHAVYVKAKGGNRWCLIGFATDPLMAEVKALNRLQYMPPQSEWDYKKVTASENAPEYINSLKRHDICLTLPVTKKKRKRTQKD